jgi:hypothetical protein
MGHPPNSVERKILDWLWEHPKGGTKQEIAQALEVHTRRVIATLKWKLEPAGEVFREGEKWFSTVAAMEFNPIPVVERMKTELEKEIRGMGAPEWLREFEAGRRMGLSFEDAWIYARNRFAELQFQRCISTGATESLYPNPNEMEQED